MFRFAPHHLPRHFWYKCTSFSKCPHETPRQVEKAEEAMKEQKLLLFQQKLQLNQ